MQTELTPINPVTRRLSVQVPWEELLDRHRAFMRKFSKKVKLPGFRKGKVPMRLIRKQFGPLAEAEFAEKVTQEFYLRALEEHGLAPINQAAIEGLNFRESERLSFQATFEVEPEVSLPDYKDRMKLEKIIYDPDEHDVAAALEDLRHGHAIMRTIEDEPASEGHYLLADLQAVTEEGLPLAGRRLDSQLLHLDSNGELGAANLAQLQGAQAGDKRRIVLTGKDQAPNYYEVTVRRISEQILPALDDSFARQVDPELPDLEALKAKLRTRIQAAFERESDKNLQHEIADQLIARSKLEVPPSMVQKYLNTLIATLENTERPETLDREQLLADHMAEISWNIRWYFLRKWLIAAEGIEIGDAQIEDHLQNRKSSDPQQAQQIKSFYRRPENRRSLRDELLTAALFERLLGFSKVKEIHKPSSDIRKAS